MTDQPRIEDEWQRFTKALLPGATFAQLANMRTAYYAGASAALKITDHRDDTPEVRKERTRQLAKDLMAFAMDLMK